MVRIPAFAFALVTLASSPSMAQRYVVGEMAEYEIRYGPVGVGSGTIGVVGIDTLRGRDAYRVRLTLHGRVNLLLYRYTIRDTMESWVDTATLSSLRFSQRQLHQGKPRVKRYEIFPERQTFADGDKPEEPSVTDPLDDISLLYYARSQPLLDSSTRRNSAAFQAGEQSHHAQGDSSRDDRGGGEEVEHGRRAADHQDVDDVLRRRGARVALGRLGARDRADQREGVGRVDHAAAALVSRGRAGDAGSLRAGFVRQRPARTIVRS